MINKNFIKTLNFKMESKNNDKNKNTIVNSIQFSDCQQSIEPSETEAQYC